MLEQKVCLVFHGAQVNHSGTWTCNVIPTRLPCLHTRINIHKHNLGDIQPGKRETNPMLDEEATRQRTA